MSNKPSHRARNCRGQILIMATLVVIPLFGMLGMVTDLGYMHFVKMSTQSAAEAAAQAAMIDFHATNGSSNPSCATVVCTTGQTNCTPSITTPQNSIEHGCMYAQAHGFNGTGSVTYETGVSGTPPTASGSGTASYWVTFRAYQRVPQLFSAVMGNLSGMVVGRSTAAVVGATDCIYALNPNASGAISVAGTASLISACGVLVDSNNSCAISTVGNATLSAPEYDVVGNVCTHNPLSPAANTGIPPAGDPLAGLPVPASPNYTCNFVNYSSPNQSTVTIHPGVYCGGIHIGNSTVTLSPGNYIIVGGGLSTQSANSVVSGTGVMIYNTYGQTNNGNYTYSGNSIAANSTATFTAPTTGPYAGILFFDDRTAPTGNPDVYGGGANAVYQGVIYDRNNGITMHGNSSINTQYTLVVADTISMVGTTAFNNNYSSLPTGSPIQQVMVVE